MNETTDRLGELRIDREATAPRSPRGLLIAASVLLIAIAGASVLWLNREQAAEVRVAVVRAGAGEAGAAASSAVLDASGYVVARLQATISSKITGRIVDVLVEEGMEIERGQVLARLDDATALRQVALAAAQLASARSVLAEIEVRLAEAGLNLRRTRELVAARVKSEADLDADQAAVDALSARLESGRDEVSVAERRLAVFRQDLEDTVIRAPFAGVAVTKNAQPGEVISPVSAGGGFTRTGVCTLVDMSSLEIEVDVNEAYINRVQPDQRVMATLDSYPEWRIPASVITVVPTADRQKATVRVRIAFDELDPRILPDMGVKVSFLDKAPPEPSSAAAPRALIPASGLRRDGDREVVFVVRDDRIERRAVRSGSRDGAEVEVLAGLEPGERVVVDSTVELADGDRVTIKGD